MQMSDSSSNNCSDALRSAEEDWQAAFDALPEAVFLFDQTKHLSRANRAGKLLEQADGSTTRRRCCDMFWRAEGAEECVVDRSAASGEAVEVEMLAGTDAPRPTLIMVMPVRDAQDELMGKTIVIVRDVSELRRA